MYPALAAPPCGDAFNVDLTLLLDTSSAVTAAGWAETVEFSQLLVGMLPVNGAQVRVSVGTYDSEVVSVGSFSSYPSVVDAAVAAIEYQEDDNGSGEGGERQFRWYGPLHAVKDRADTRPYDQATRLVLMVMHNRNEDPSGTTASETASALKAAGTNMFTVCVNCGKDLELPSEIASGKGSGATAVATAAALGTIATAADVVDTLCNAPGFDVDFEARSAALAAEASLLRNLLSQVILPDSGLDQHLGEFGAAALAALADDKVERDLAIQESCDGLGGKRGAGDDGSAGEGGDDEGGDEGGEDLESTDAPTDAPSWFNNGDDNNGGDGDDNGNSEAEAKAGGFTLTLTNDVGVVDRETAGKGGGVKKGPAKKDGKVKKLKKSDKGDGKKGGKKLGQLKVGSVTQDFNADAALKAQPDAIASVFAGYEFVALLAGVCISVFLGTVVATAAKSHQSTEEAMHPLEYTEPNEKDPLLYSSYEFEEDAAAEYSLPGGNGTAGMHALPRSMRIGI